MKIMTRPVIASGLTALALLVNIPGAHASEPSCESNHFILNRPCVDILRTWRWSLAGQLIEPRYGHSATRLPSGLILITGGFRFPSLGRPAQPLGSAELYDPATGVSRLAGEMSTLRGGNQATLLVDGRLLVTGESATNPSPESLGLTGSAEVFDPATGRWTSAGRMNTPRVAHTMTLLTDGSVLVAGGVDDADDTIASAEIYDPASNSWRYTASMQAARFQHTAVRLPDGTVLVAAGSDDDFLGTVIASAERYDPVSRTWSTAHHVSIARQWHTATLLPDGDVLVVGGYATHPEPAPGGGFNMVPRSYATVDRFGPSGWSVSSPLNIPRQGHATALLPGGMVLATGGKDWTRTRMEWWGSSGTAEVYDPAIRAWRLVGDMRVVRGAHTATALADGRVVVIGGYSSSLSLGFDAASHTIEIFGPSSSAVAGNARSGRH